MVIFSASGHTGSGPGIAAGLGGGLFPAPVRSFNRANFAQRFKGARAVQPALVGEMFKNILIIGQPASLQGMTRPVTGAVMMWIVALFGTEAVASFGVGLRLLSFCFILIAGLNMGTATMVGQSLGARLKDLTEEVISRAMKLALAIQTAMGLIAFTAAPAIMGVFAEDPLVIEMGISYIRMITPALVAMGPLHVIAATFKGAGNTVPHMLSALVANWLIKIPLAMFFAFILNFETNGVWLAITLSIFAELGIMYLWYRKREWLYRGMVTRVQDGVV